MSALIAPLTWLLPLAGRPDGGSSQPCALQSRTETNTGLAVASPARSHSIEWMPVSTIRSCQPSRASLGRNGLTVLALLAQHIQHVVALSAEKQVVGIHAGWNVTAMAHAQAAWNRTVRPTKRQAMSQPSHSSELEYPVAVRAFCASKEPTAAWAVLVYSRPKQFSAFGLARISMKPLRTSQ